LTIQIALNTNSSADFTTLQDVINQARTNTDAFTSIKTAFSNFMPQLTLAHAVPINYTYAPMSNNFNVTGGNTLPSGKVVKLEAIYNHYYDIKVKKNF